MRFPWSRPLAPHASPTPPSNVRLQLRLRDGTIRYVPVECTYVGYTNGVHHWRTTMPTDATGVVQVQCLVDVLPDHTEVQVDLSAWASPSELPTFLPPEVGGDA